jgi:hypothetical protein
MIKILIRIAGLNCRAGDATEANSLDPFLDSVAIWQQKGLSKPNSTTREMQYISREKVERMRNMILEYFSAKYFSSPGSKIHFYSVAEWK